MPGIFVNIETDFRLKKIIENLNEKYGCHTIILYGSRARNDANENSDYDIIAIREKGDVERDCTIVENAYLDVFVYSEEAIQEPDISFIRMKDGIVLTQKNNMGDELIDKVKTLYQKGPEKRPDWEKKLISTWALKMLGRARVEDVEGNFRRHWLLFDLLEAYFHMRDQWYLGPKESFQWMKNNDAATYSLFEKALKPNADLNSLETLIHGVTALQLEPG